MKILIIEDDKQTAQMIKNEMKGNYAVDLAYTGESGEYLSETNDYDTIVIDLRLPDIDGITVCKRIREAGIKTPILVLTGSIEMKNKIAALDSGADDYLTKPFSFAELMARIRALMRRSPQTLNSNVLSFDGLTLDVSKNRVERNGKEVHLRRKEFSLLEYLMRNPGLVLTRNMILGHVWEEGIDQLTNTIDVHIKFLRDKIDIPLGTSLIKTVYGLGYKLEA